MKKLNIHSEDFYDQLSKQLDIITQLHMENERKEFKQMYYNHTIKGIQENRERKLLRVFGNENE